MFYKNKLKVLVAGLSFLLVATISITSCGESKKVSSESAKNGILTIAANPGATNQFPENFNFSGTYGTSTTAPGIPLFYESLWAFSPHGELMPRLAATAPEYKFVKYPASAIAKYKKDIKEHIKEAVKEKDPTLATSQQRKDFYDSHIATANQGMQQLIIHLRKNVTWNDGTKFTAKDVAFSLDNSWYTAGWCHSIYACYLWDKTKVVDDNTAIITFNGSHYEQMGVTVVPEHIYKQVPLSTENNGNTIDHPNSPVKVRHLDRLVDKNPVGTGPGKLLKFNGQKISIQLRDDYWGGKPDYVKQIDFVPEGQAAKIQGDITSGKVDWAEGSVNDIERVFVQKTEDNHFMRFPTGGARGIIFGCNLEPTNDKYVRKALTLSLDLTEPQKAAKIGYQIPSQVGLNVDLWKDFIIPGYQEPLKMNLDAAKQALVDGGWTVNSNGNLEKAGKEYPLDLWISNGDTAEDMVTVPLIYKQWEQNLGIKVGYHPIGDVPWRDAMNKHKYQLFTNFATNSGTNPAGAWSAYSWGHILYNDGPNPGQWKVSKEVNDAIYDVAKYPITDLAKMKELGEIQQKGVVEDYPFIPYETSGTGVMWTTKNWVGWPDKVSSKYYPIINPFSGGNASLISVIKDLKPAEK